ncbi:restriction endonuclease subunit S, partial [Helicobacter muridarum]|uniref:restriction endonuclease subunit S n=1 Tax=Helicobacter muridarum TaxID=216 RepID=UPI0018F7F077
RGGGVNNASFVAFKIQIFRIYFPQIKAKLRDSKRAYRLGEWELLENLLGLETLSFSKNSFDKNIKSFKFSKNSHTQKLNISIQSLSQSFGVSGRLDSEYYQVKYERNEAMIKSKPYVRLRDIVAIQKSIEPGSEAYRESGIPFIRVSNLSAFGISQSEVYLDSKDFNEKQLESLYPKKGTILFSKDGSVGISYCVENDLECVTSGAILHLTIKNKALILPQYLSLVLNALPTKLQAQRDSGGSIIAHWKISEIENLLIPLLDLKIQKQIQILLIQSLALRAKSKELLEKAKAKVEEKISLL